MTEHDSPIWLRDRDGREVPFDADRLCQSLFGATEELGRPDAFLARELTDGVAHFLSEEVNGTPPSTDELPELVAKVVRELGQPALARQYETSSRRAAPVPSAHVGSYSVAPENPTEFSLSEVFPKNLVAAHDGMLTLWGLNHPLELTGSVLGPGPGLRESLRIASERTGEFVAIDSPEYALSALPGEPAALATEYVRELRAGLRVTGLAAVVNLNAATPPTRDRELADGPLFAEIRQPLDPTRVADLAIALHGELLKAAPDPRLSIVWHLTAADFQRGKMAGFAMWRGSRQVRQRLYSNLTV